MLDVARGSAMRRGPSPAAMAFGGLMAAPCAGRYPGWPPRIFAFPYPAHADSGFEERAGSIDPLAVDRCGDSTGKGTFALLFPV